MQSNPSVKIAILGANGYIGRELIAQLLKHPKVKISYLFSRHYEGKSLAKFSPRFANSNLSFTKFDIKKISSVDCVFLALPHGVSHRYVEKLLDQKVKVIDLSADFRLDDPKIYRKFYRKDHKNPELLKKFVYGLVELYAEEIKKANLIASPGCYPTSILLPLCPLLKSKLIKPKNIIASSISGISGAGKKLVEKNLFVERNESIKAYDVTGHRHVAEIEQELSKVAKEKVVVDFIPHLSPMSRGIYSTIVVDLCPNAKQEEVENSLKKFYQNSPFVHILDAPVDSQLVTHTNFCHIYAKVNPRTEKLIITSVIDNLVKGAAGQAIQAFNLINSFDENLGLF